MRLPVKAVARKVGIRLMKKRSEIAIPWQRGDVLDIGCGLGYLVRYVGKGQRYVGIDINEEQISLLKHEHANYPNREFWSVDIDKDDIAVPPAISDSTFDTITLLAVIEHLRNPEKVLTLARILLKNEGSLLITTPTSVGDKIGSLISMVGRGTRTLPYPHMRIYTRESLIALLEEIGFQVKIYKRFELGMNQFVTCSKRLG